MDRPLPDPEDLLASDDPSDRVRGVRWLDGPARRRLIPALMEALLDPADEVSGAAAARLRDLGTAKEVPALTREFTDPERFPGTFHSDIPYVWALEALHVADASTPLVEALGETDHPAVVKRCVNLLRDLGDIRSRPALEALLNDLPTDADREDGDPASTKALDVEGILGVLEEAEARAEAMPDVEAIREGLRAEDFEEGEQARRRLDEWTRTAGTDELVEALADTDDEVSKGAADALAVQLAREAVPDLVRELARAKRCLAAEVVQYPYAEKTDLDHGEHAWALVRIDDPAAVEPLLEAMEDQGNEWVRWELVWVLGWLGEPRALEAVQGELEALEGVDGSGWRYRALVANAETAVTRLQEAAEREGTRG